MFKKFQPVKRISLAYQELERVPENVIARHGADLEEIDLTENYISDFTFLRDTPNLCTLIADSNGITNHVKFPSLPSLHTLWVNNNKITNIGVFISTICQSFPNLRYLCMMNNDAAPSFFNGGSYPQFVDYRYYVISHFPKLEMLDDRPVTDEERREAERIYKKYLTSAQTSIRRKTSSTNLKKS